MAISYREYVPAQKQRSPTLGNLCHFFDEGCNENGCQIASLVFTSATEAPQRHDLEIKELECLLQNSVNADDHIQGRILIIENLTCDLVELLGSSLDIDPLFFASHLHSPKVDIAIPTPSMNVLPSKARGQNFLSQQYHKVVQFESRPLAPRKMSRDSNVPRKMVMLPSTKNIYLGLAQHGCSVLLNNTKGLTWLGIILVDAPTKSRYASPEKQTILPSKPFQGGYEEFLNNPAYSDIKASGPERTSLLEDLVYYWTQARPPAFNPESPSLLALAYYPLRIIAAEWVSYVQVMNHSVKQYEYSTEASGDAQGLTKLDSDLRSLQGWGRRCIQTQHKLRSVIKFLSSRISSTDAEMEPYSLLIEDYEHISAMVETYGRRLEAMVPVVTSLVQIADTRRSMREAANVTRLTNLALLFVPLSFVSGLFSMNETVTARGLARYFAVAIPLCALVFFVARLLPYVSVDGIKGMVGRFRGVEGVEVD